MSEADRAELASWLRSQRLAQVLGMRARVVMLSAEGHSLRGIAERLGVTQRTVCLWRVTKARGSRASRADIAAGGHARSVGVRNWQS